MMKKMFQECNLIHADLSEYNMLWHDDRLWFIDVSQSIEPTHPRALEFLVRDCTNVVGFFQKVCQSDVMSVEQLFNYVSGLDIVGKEEDFLNQVFKAIYFSYVIVPHVNYPNGFHSRQCTISLLVYPTGAAQHIFDQGGL